MVLSKPVSELTSVPPDTEAPERAGRADARQNRARLLAAAREVLRERGIHGEVTEIAARAGVGAGTLYRHFPSKDVLISAVAQELSEAILAELESAQQTDDPRAALASIVQAGYRLVGEYGQLFLTLMSGGAPPALYEAFDEERIAGIIGGIVQRGIDRGQFRADLDVEHTVGLLYALFAPISLNELMRHRSLDVIAEASTRFFLAGLDNATAREARSPQSAPPPKG